MKSNHNQMKMKKIIKRSLLIISVLFLLLMTVIGVAVNFIFTLEKLTPNIFLTQKTEEEKSQTEFRINELHIN